MNEINVKYAGGRKCAFCKHWYDPNNLAISPKTPAINLWEYDNKAKNKCLINGVVRKAAETCGKFELKVEIR